MHATARLVRPLALALVASVAPLAAGASRAQQPTPQPQPPAEEFVQSVDVQRIRGRADMASASTQVANLDAGDLVAGWTWWIQDGGWLWTETYVGFLFTPGAETEVFEIPQAQYLDDNWHVSEEIADDGTVVGTNIFTSSPFVHLPYTYTSEAGFRHLEVPQSGTWYGQADAVSSDGTVVAGSVQPGLGADTVAARWIGGTLQVLGRAGQVSRGNDLSDDGTILVGAVGPTTSTLRATRWVGAVEVPLALVPGATASEALFVSDDGAVAVGTATVGGVEVLARWAADGTVATFAPPAGLAVENLHAISASGSAAVGALSDEVPFQEDWDPFVWREGQGITVIDELAPPGTYEVGQARDVSDDGNVVVGQLQARVVFEGEPPTIAFRWTPETGTQDLDRMLTAVGRRNEGLYDAFAISGDGTRIAVTGTRRPRPQDTTSMIVEFVNGSPLK